MANDNNKTEFLNMFIETTSTDYPVSVYYVDFAHMFMGMVHHHWHSKMEIDYVRTGTAIFKIGEESVSVNAGSAILINNDQIHSIKPENEDETIILSVLFHPDYLFDEKESFLATKYKAPLTSNTDFSYCIFTKDTRVGRNGLECINSIINCNLNKSYGYELMTKSLLCNLWIQLLSLAENSDKKVKSLTRIDEERVKDAIVYIQNNYGKALTLEEIAGSIHLSKSECCRCFKRATNLTPFEYLMFFRIYESAFHMQRSEHGNQSISSLATSVGFNNASYFNKIFKKYLGRTPLQYREEIKKSHRDALNPYGISIAKM